MLNDEDDHVPNELVELMGVSGKNGTYSTQSKGLITFKAKSLGKDFRIVKVVIHSKLRIDILAEEGSTVRKIPLVQTGQKDTFEGHIDDTVDSLVIAILEKGSARIEIQSCRSTGKSHSGRRDDCDSVSSLWKPCLFYIILKLW